VQRGGGGAPSTASGWQRTFLGPDKWGFTGADREDCSCDLERRPIHEGSHGRKAGFPPVFNREKGGQQRIPETGSRSLGNGAAKKG